MTPKELTNLNYLKMRNLRTPLLILVVLSALTTMVAAYLTVLQSEMRSTFFTIALFIYGALFLLALFDILSSRIYSGKEKLLWTLAVLFGNVLGVLLYILVGRKQAIVVT